MKVIGEAFYPLTLSAFWRTRKSSVPCRVQAFVQVLWLLASPKMARGMGSKDADNAIKGGTDYQSGLVVLPTPSQVHRPSQPMI
jgi:hypothetical protein